MKKILYLGVILFATALISSCGSTPKPMETIDFSTSVGVAESFMNALYFENYEQVASCCNPVGNKTQQKFVNAITSKVQKKELDIKKYKLIKEEPTRNGFSYTYKINKEVDLIISTRQYGQKWIVSSF